MGDQQQGDGSKEQPTDSAPPTGAVRPEVDPLLEAVAPRPSAEAPTDAIEQPKDEAPPEGTEQNMEIHKPHVAKSWREFFIEIGTIVIGILIALGLEQAVGRWHQRQQDKEAHAAIDEELREGLATAHVIQASRGCRQQQLQALAVTLGKGDLDHVRSMLNESSIIPVFKFSDAAWTTALATGAANHFNQQERSDYGSASFVSVHVNDWYADYRRSEQRLIFLTQSSLGRSPAASSQAVAQLADMASIMKNVEGATSAYVAIIEDGRGLKATRANYDALPDGTHFLQQCQAAAKAMEAMAGKG